MEEESVETPVLHSLNMFIASWHMPISPGYLVKHALRFAIKPEQSGVAVGAAVVVVSQALAPLSAPAVVGSAEWASLLPPLMLFATAPTALFNKTKQKWFR